MKGYLHAEVKGQAEDRYGLSALQHRLASAKMIRISDIGDPCALSDTAVRALREAAAAANLFIVGFTHGWRQAPLWRGILMASVGSLDEADEAIDAGWRAAVVLPSTWSPGDKTFRTPKGRRGVVCPSMIDKAKGRVTYELRRGKKVTVSATQCNSCLICREDWKPAVVGFPDHSAAARGSAWR